MNFEYKLLIDGKWVQGANTAPIYNPYSNEKIGLVPETSPEQVDLAIASAFENRSIMEEMPIYRRAEILEETARLLSENKKKMIKRIVLESGKTWKWAEVEVVRGIENLKFAAEASKNLHGETVPLDASKGSEGRMGFWFRVPVGVVGAIAPFNFPLNLVIHKVAPAIAAGNTVVLKPATNTPGPAQLLVELLLKAGLPATAIQFLCGKGSVVGEAIARDERIAKITFTGSPMVGKHLTTICGLKKLTLELGSNSGVIIDESADLDWAVARTVMGGFAFSGQVCISVQRIYVHKKIANAFIERFVSETKKQKIGDPMDPGTDVGPMISEQEAKRVEEWIKEAVNKGAKLLTGGNRKGCVLEPTVLTDVQNDMRVMNQEVFGPVVSIVTFDDFKEAIRLVNDSRFGLQAGLFSGNFQNIMYAIKKLDVGGVMVNDVPTYRVDQMPYGGVKESGIGREGARFAVEEMTNIKMVMLK